MICRNTWIYSISVQYDFFNKYFPYLFVNLYSANSTQRKPKGQSRTSVEEFGSPDKGGNFWIEEEEKE